MRVPAARGLLAPFALTSGFFALPVVARVQSAPLAPPTREPGARRLSLRKPALRRPALARGLAGYPSQRASSQVRSSADIAAIVRAVSALV